jgi:UDP-N-acetyl-D-mannosaminuronic acid dehydrogenase
MNVGIIGLGYVGLTLAVVASLKKFKVYAVERSSHIKESLQRKVAHFYEPGLNPLIANHLNKNLFVVDKFEKDQNLNVFIITVGTPLLGETKEPNLDYIRSAMDQLKGVYTGDELIILRSTISVGTTASVVIPFLSKLCGKKPEDLLVAFCPERTIEGKAVRELQELPQIIGGNNKRSLALAENFFREITPTIIKVDSLEAAELIKLFNNTYRDIHFALGNVFNEIAQSFGINGVKLIRAANVGYERSSIPVPGFVGGPCLEKDPYILTHNMKDSDGKRFVINARKYNESLEMKIVQWAIKICDQYKLPRKVCVSGLAFKGIPDTSDLRGSNSVNICNRLKQLDFDLDLHDFFAIKEEVDALGIGKFTDDIYEASEGHSILLIWNNNVRYSRMDVVQLIKGMKDNALILDAWGVIDYLENVDSHQVEVFTLGTIEIEHT